MPLSHLLARLVCLWGRKLNFTLPAAGCLGPPGSANTNCWLAGTLAWERAAEQSVLTCLSIWQTIINNLSLTLWVTSSAAVEFLPCEQRWHFCSRASLHARVSAQAHTLRLIGHLIGKQRLSIYFSLLKSTERDEISHQSLLSQSLVTWRHSSSLSHTCAHTYMQTSKQWDPLTEKNGCLSEKCK